ncbi:SDR family NAD(P)-dependent oxidoreductase [Nocardia macrotermitis]|uniref:Putative oxidoreductase n=1 Tax=Nocardia macrotermitis TaxID=2585198 RepID=A0A7K0D710_9NOCA|nr:SDR family NAD(P)-dependent oxidoreductase [Nocardia macrotermitis]MQY21550.1 putative oxidoreductase [Nocardia macrotermitis]
MGSRLEGKTILVTGAAGALGSAVARSCAAEGAALVLADLNVEAVQALADEIGAAGATASAERLDVTDGDEFDALVAASAQRYGTLNGLVNTAGIVSPNARIHHLSTQDFERTVSVNLTGTFHAIRAVARALRKRSPVSIVNIASVSGLTAWSYAAPYCASKAGVIHLTRVAALEYAKEGIRVNAVCPGTFPTALHETLPAEAMQAIEAKHPLGLGSPDNLTGAVVYLASDESSWVTGHSLVVDGGYSLP